MARQSDLGFILRANRWLRDCHRRNCGRTVTHLWQQAHVGICDFDQTGQISRSHDAALYERTGSGTGDSGLTSSLAPYVWPGTLRLPSQPPKIVYLDLNQWIEFAKAWAGHPAGAAHKISWMLAFEPRVLRKQSFQFPIPFSLKSPRFGSTASDAFCGKSSRPCLTSRS